MSRTIKFTSQFKKDVKLMKKQGKNLDKLFDIVDKLAKDEALNEKTETTIYLETIKILENVILKQIGY